MESVFQLKSLNAYSNSQKSQASQSFSSPPVPAERDIQTFCKIKIKKLNNFLTTAFLLFLQGLNIKSIEKQICFHKAVITFFLYFGGGVFYVAVKFPSFTVPKEHCTVPKSSFSHSNSNPATNQAMSVL